MNKEFVPYEEALALKELGFNEPCFRWYDERWGDDLQQDKFNTNKDLFMTDLDCSAPLYQQAFRWFREKYGFVIRYIPHEIDDNEGQSILHHYYKISEYDNWRGGRRNTVETELSEEYEEAELECLKKLIEIVKEK